MDKNIIVLIVLVISAIVGRVIVYYISINNISRKVKLVESTYGVDTILRALGWENIQYPIIGVRVYGENATKALFQKASLTNFGIDTAERLVKKRSIGKGRVKPILAVSTLQDYKESFIFPTYRKLNRGNDFVFYNYMYKHPGMNVDYIIDATRKKYMVKKVKLEEIHLKEVDKRIAGLEFEKLEGTEEVVGLDEIKQQVLDARTTVQRVRYSGIEKEINAAASMEQLVLVMKKFDYRF